LAKTKQKIRATKVIDENRYVILIMLAAFLVLVFVLSSYKIEDDDFFWHLSTGKYIVENKVIPDKDVFSYPTENQEWIPFEWGWDLIIYSIYSINNVNAVSIFSSVIFCVIFFIYFRLLNRFKVNSIISILLLFFLVIAIFNRLSARPHLFTYLFFIILLYFLVSLKYLEREKYFKKLFFLPVIFLIWGNIHLGVIAGGLLLFTFVINEIIIFYYPAKFSNKQIIPFEKKHLKRIIMVSFLCLFILLINPHGLETYFYAYSHIKMKMLESIAEWQNPFTGQVEGGIVIILYKLFLFLGLIILFYAYKRKDTFFALIYIVFAIYSVRAIRFNIDYEIIILFFIAVSTNEFIISLRKKSIMQFIQSNYPKIVIILFFIYVISQTFSDNIYLTLKYNRHFGFGINDSFIPYKMIDFMKENNIHGRTFNNYESGGYYLWNFTGVKNFIDSRNINDEVFSEYMSISLMKTGFDNKLEKYGVDNIQYFEPKLVKYPQNMRNHLPAYLTLNSKWKLIYWDDKSMLFIKDTPENAELINKYEYKILIPYKAVFFQKDFENAVINFPERTKMEMNRKEAEEHDGFYYSGMNEIITKVLKK